MTCAAHAVGEHSRAVAMACRGGRAAPPQTRHAIRASLVLTHITLSGELIMKPTFVIAAACAALLVGSGIVNAQNTPSSSANTGTADTSTSADKSKGNNLDTTSKSPRADPTTAPATTGQRSE